MKQLIVFYTVTQNNELLAKALQERLGCDLLKIETVKKRSPFSIFMDILFNRRPAIQPYRIDRDIDQYVFVSPIWMGRIASPLRTFLKNEKDNIKRYAFITWCGGVQGQKEKIENELTTLLAKRPEKVMELWVSNLLTAEQKKNIGSYKVTEMDLGKYKEKIDEFLAHCKSPAKETMTV